MGIAGRDVAYGVKDGVILAGITVAIARGMSTTPESITLRSLDDNLAAALFLPESSTPSPAVIICHGAGEFKENYYELCEFLAGKGIVSLAVDMHGHGSSGGERFHVNIEHWVADIQASLDFLSNLAAVDASRIGAFGLSSGGTAILEAAIIEPRLKALIALDATVRNSLPLPLTLFMKSLLFVGNIKKRFSNSDWRIPLAKISGGLHLASDPEIDRQIQSNPRALEAFMSFPLPGAASAFFVDTITRVGKIKAPTLVLWGEDDKLDPPETARLLFAALACEKKLEIIAGNGHVGHLDRNKEKVFEATSEWLQHNLGFIGSSKAVYETVHSDN
jgi:alpha-beta hydrolase superfamily lysophospholipase